MSTAEENAAAVRSAFVAWDACKASRGAMWEPMLSDDLEMYSLAAGRTGAEFTSPKSGRDAFADYVQGLTSLMSMEYWRVDECIGAGDRVFVMGETSWTYKATGRTLTTPIMAVFRFRDGKICEYREFYDTAAMMEAAQPAP